MSSRKDLIQLTQFIVAAKERQHVRVTAFAMTVRIPNSRSCMAISGLDSMFSPIETAATSTSLNVAGILKAILAAQEAAETAAT